MTLALLSVPGTISGTVADLSSEIPIEGATVVIEPGGYAAGSNAEGGYTLENVVARTYTVSAFKGGYAVGREDGISVLGGETQRVNFKLSLLGTGSIEGVVTDAVSGEKVVCVEVRAAPGDFFTTSDSEGNYIISDIKAGDYTLSVLHGGYLPYRKNQIGVAQDETLRLNIELQPCPFSVLGLSKKKLKKVRRLRDEILLKNQMGKKWVSSFYQHAPTVSSYIFSNPAFRSRLLELADLLMPKIEDILTAKKMSLTPRLIKKVKECFAKLGLKDSHNFSAAVHQLITALHDEEVLKQFGIAVEKQVQKSD